MEYIDVTIKVRECDWEEIKGMIRDITGNKEVTDLKANQFIGLIIEWYLLEEFFNKN